MHNDLLTHLLGYLHTDPPENTFSLFTIMLLFRLTIKTYLSPQLLVYLPIDVLVHDPTCSFSYNLSDNRYQFTFMLLFHLTTKTYLSPQLLVFLPIDVPVHDPTC